MSTETPAAEVDADAALAHIRSLGERQSAWALSYLGRCVRAVLDDYDDLWGVIRALRRQRDEAEAKAAEMEARLSVHAQRFAATEIRRLTAHRAFRDLTSELREYAEALDISADALAPSPQTPEEQK